MAASYSITLHDGHARDEGPVGLARVLTLLRGGDVPPRDDRGFAGPDFAALVPDLAAEAAGRTG